MKRKIFSILFALVLVLSLGLVMAVPVAAATLTVDTSVPVSATNFHTIQAAVNAAAPYDTIIVHPGTYTESVSITTDNLTLKASEPVIVDPPDGANKSCFIVQADYVTIRGFELTGAAGYDCMGIYFWGSYNTFTNNEIHNIAPTGNGGGICCWDYDGGSDYNTISNNTIYDVSGGDGILIGACTLSAVNTGNVIKNNTISSCGTWHPGIEAVNGDQCTIVRNSISGYTGWPQYYGILIVNWSTIVTGNHNISHNEAEGFYTGIELMAWTSGGAPHGLAAVSNVTITANLISHNDVHDNLYHGIDLRGIPHTGATALVTSNTISRNSSHDNGYNGFYLRASADTNTIDHNDALNNGGDGIKVSGDNNSIHHNTATGNGNYDLEDLGTGNTWFKNTYVTSNPSGL